MVDKRISLTAPNVFSALRENQSLVITGTLAWVDKRTRRGWYWRLAVPNPERAQRKPGPRLSCRTGGRGGFLQRDYHQPAFATCVCPEIGRDRGGGDCPALCNGHTIALSRNESCHLHWIRSAW